MNKRKKIPKDKNSHNILPDPVIWIKLRLTGLKPATSALQGHCSDQLNYNPKKQGHNGQYKQPNKLYK